MYGVLAVMYFEMLSCQRTWPARQAASTVPGSGKGFRRERRCMRTGVTPRVYEDDGLLPDRFLTARTQKKAQSYDFTLSRPCNLRTGSDLR